MFNHYIRSKANDKSIKVNETIHNSIFFSPEGINFLSVINF